MAESSKSVNQDPAMSNIFQGLSEDTIRLAFTMAQLMESKDKNNLEAVLKTLNLTEAPGADDKMKKPLNVQELPNDMAPENSANG